MTISNFIFSNNLFLAFPDELNFELQNSVNITFFMGAYENKKKISIIDSKSSSGTNLTYLNCKNLGQIKKCEISISFFARQKYNKSEYGYILCSDDNIKSIEYGLNPIKITLPENIIFINIESERNSNTQLTCQNGMLFLITDYNDPSNIFEVSDVEEKTFFKTTIIKKLNSSIIYNVNCRLWKPKSDNLIIICSIDKDFYLNEKLSLEIYFHEAVFDYNGHRVVINSNAILTLQIINTHCPFLYADEQIINVNKEVKIMI